MYIIVSYDVEQVKCNKIMKIMRKYLFHIHNSVFEGELTNKQFNEMIKDIKEISINENDRIVFYKLVSNKVLTKEHYGSKKDIKLIY